MKFLQWELTVAFSQIILFSVFALDIINKIYWGPGNYLVDHEFKAKRNKDLILNPSKLKLWLLLCERVDLKYKKAL